MRYNNTHNIYKYNFKYNNINIINIISPDILNKFPISFFKLFISSYVKINTKYKINDIIPIK